ncbi:MAG: protein-glutamate O-methyltransferase CheR [Deltaproteobacteria bacterium]|nr:protein-glutamate O-methyltransferase CheR [Deltaproteobacteria bacterium]
MDLPALEDREFGWLRQLVVTHTGIALSASKRSLLQTRLSKRLRHLGLHSYGEYCEYLTRYDPEGVERTAFINAVTTKVTAFFRELHHFTYLKDVWLPAWFAQARGNGTRCLRIWSAGCATGQEPYSIAMTILESLPAGQRWDIRIFASDIDSDALEQAQSGHYSRAEVARLPAFLRRRYFTGSGRGLVRLSARVRELVGFANVNLLDQAWPLPGQVDAIFCRNVLIYFDRPTKGRIVQGFESRLREHGLLLLGHSEGLLGLGAGFRVVGPTMYQRRSGAAHHVQTAAS